MKRICSLLVIIVLAIMSLSSCSVTNDKPVTITIQHGWGTMEADAVAMRGIYQDFEKTYPGVRLEQISMPSTEQVITRVGDQLAVGITPDIVFLAGIGSTLLRYMQRSGAALNLAGYIEADEAFRSSISPAALDCWQGDDGSIYTLPDVLWQYGLWVNTQLLAQTGTTQMPTSWTDFFEVCDEILKWADGAGNDVVPVQLVSNDMPILIKLIMAGDSPEGRAMAESGKIDYTSDVFIRALDVIRRLASYSVHSAQTYEYRDALGVFNEGKSVFYINGIWANSLIDDSIQASCVAFPGGENGTVALQTALSGYVVGNTGDVKRMDASVAFVKYMLSADVQKRILLETGQYPANPSIDLTQYAKILPRLINGAAAISNCDVRLTRPVDVYDEAERTRLRGCIGRMLSENLTAREAARLMQ